MSTHDPVFNLREGSNCPVRGVDIEKREIESYRQKDDKISLFCDLTQRRGIRAIIHPAAGVENKCGGWLFAGRFKYDEFIHTYVHLRIRPQRGERCWFR